MTALAIDDWLGLLERRAAGDRHLAVLVTASPEPGSDPQVSVVNAGVLRHPLTDRPVVGLVARGQTAKLANLRRNPRAALVFRDGWEWVAVRGAVELAGPDDQLDGLDDGAHRQLLRDIYAAAGGDHPDLEEYDRTLRAEGRCAVLVAPDRIWTNPSGTDHRDPDQ